MQHYYGTSSSSNPTDIPEYSDEIRLRRKAGVEIVRSPDLTSRFFHGPRRQRHVFTWNDNDASAWRVARATR